MQGCLKWNLITISVTQYRRLLYNVFVNNIISKIKKQAEAQGIPIILDDMRDFLVLKTSKLKPKAILEIGSGIGYSAAVLADANPNVEIITIEKDEARAKLAEENLKGFLTCTVLNCDAMDFLKTHSEELFDFIFLDGPKSQYVNYLPYLINILKTNGVLICDNIFFHGAVDSETYEVKAGLSKDVRQLATKLKRFILAALNESWLKTEIINKADGIMVAKKV